MTVIFIFRIPNTLINDPQPTVFDQIQDLIAKCEHEESQGNTPLIVTTKAMLCKM
jgi:hypothetical protein